MERIYTLEKKVWQAIVRCSIPLSRVGVRVNQPGNSTHPVSSRTHITRSLNAMSRTICSSSIFVDGVAQRYGPELGLEGMGGWMEPRVSCAPAHNTIPNVVKTFDMECILWSLNTTQTHHTLACDQPTGETVLTNDVRTGGEASSRECVQRRGVSVCPARAFSPKRKERWMV